MLLRRWAAALLLAFALPLAPLPAKTAATAAAPASPWPFAESDLPLDPGFRFGTLPNGMRYIVRANATPAGQGMVQMWVHQGSLAEHDDEVGWAHFIEHMAFNGSTHVP